MSDSKKTKPLTLYINGLLKIKNATYVDSKNNYAKLTYN